jgi:hypothetical protein
VVSVASVKPVGRVWKFVLSTMLVEAAEELATELAAELAEDAAAELAEDVATLEAAAELAEEAATLEAATELAEDAAVLEAVELAVTLETAEEAAEDATLDAEDEFVLGDTVLLSLLPSPPPQAISSRLVARAVSPPFITEFPAIIVMLLQICLLSITKVCGEKKPTLFAPGLKFSRINTRWYSIRMQYFQRDAEGMFGCDAPFRVAIWFFMKTKSPGQVLAVLQTFVWVSSTLSRITGQRTKWK